MLAEIEVLIKDMICAMWSRQCDISIQSTFWFAKLTGWVWPGIILWNSWKIHQLEIHSWCCAWLRKYTPSWCWPWVVIRLQRVLVCCWIRAQPWPLPLWYWQPWPINVTDQQFGFKLSGQFQCVKRSFGLIFSALYLVEFPSQRTRAPSQYKDHLIYVWRFPC